MEAFALYLIKSVVWLTGFALVYLIFLRNERYFLLNRMYLVSGIVASIVFPFFTWHYTIVIPMVPSIEVSDLQITGIIKEPEPFPTKEILLILYLAGGLYLLYRVVRQTITVLRVIRQSEIRPYRSAKLIRTAAYPSSFSFFSFVFVNPSSSETEMNEIVNHEMEHVRQKHWIDLVLFELLCTLQWFNPLCWLYGRFIRQNHEFLADQHALQCSAHPAIYRAALINQLFGAEVISLANSFNYSINKKRFHMMKNTIQSPIRKLKLLVILPLIAGVFYAFATPEYRYAQTDLSVTQQAEKTITGKVINEKGNPLKGATVIISGTTTGTTTDDNGAFKLKITDDSPLVISYVGLGSQKVTPDTENEMIITMKTENIGIDQVTVVGYGINPNQASQGSTATGQINSPFQLRNIDGSGAQPLYVIDGVINENANIRNIDAETIQSINVIKDATAISKYGEKAKNGVVEIITKSNSKASTTNAVKVVTGQPSKLSNSDGSLKNPLVVIDGVIAENQDLNSLSPETIQSVSVLKNESATTLFGEKGKNGVVLVITKKGSSTSQTSQNDEQVYMIVEQMPVYPGGEPALRQFLASNIKYPMTAVEKKVQGKVFVTFVVDQTGKVTDVKIVRGVDPSLDQEAIRVVQTMPLWIPGKHDGKIVAVQYTIPINFVLEPAMTATKEATDNKPNIIVEQMPEYPGGPDALRKFIAFNIKYPRTAVENNAQGKVFVSFTVTKTGAVGDAKIARGVDPSLDQEALRIVESMPAWIPGKQNGETVDVAYTIPIEFVLQKPEKTEANQQNVPQMGKLIIVPNPAESKATVTLEGSDSTNALQVTIVDGFGKIIKNEKKKGPSFTISVSSLTPGTYRIVAIDGNKQFQGSLIVNH
jgi:TonB family protein